MSYIGTEPKDIRSFGRTKFDYTATQGQTAFTGADDDGKVLAFTTGQIEVYVNGILMDDSDFTTTGTGTVTLASAANLNDVVNVVSFESNIPDNDYVPASGGTFTGNVTHTGSFTSKGIDDNADATAITIDSSENVMVGKTATNYQTVGVEAKPDGSLFATANNNGALVVTRKSSDGNITSFYKDSTNVGNIGTNSHSQFELSSSAALTLEQNSTTTKNLYFSDTTLSTFDGSQSGTVDLGRNVATWKDLYLGGGIYLGGTGAANKLEDYEEGTFTPSFVNGGTFSTLNAKYIKVGKLCYVGFYIHNIASIPNNSNLAEITGFPFANSNDGNQYHGVGTVSYVNSANWSQYDVLGPTPRKGSNSCYFHRGSGTAAGLSNSDFRILNGHQLIFALIYQTD